MEAVPVEELVSMQIASSVAILVVNREQLVGEGESFLVEVVRDLGKDTNGANAVFVECVPRHEADRLLPCQDHLVALLAQFVRQISHPFESGQRDIVLEA